MRQAWGSASSVLPPVGVHAGAICRGCSVMEVGANRLWTGVNSRDGRGSFAAAGEAGGTVLAAEHNGGLAAERRRADQLPQKLQALSQLA